MAKAVLIWSLLAWSATATFGQSTQPSRSYDWSTPLAADASLRLANHARDQAAVTRAYHADNGDQRALLSALNEQWVAGMTLHEACLARFKRELPSGSVVRPADNRIEADVQGDEAIVYPGGKQLGLGITWVRINGEWKVAMSQILRAHLMTYKSLPRAIDEKRAWTKELRRLTDEIKAGRYSSPEDVDKALDDLAEASDRTPSTQPSGK